MINRLRRFLLLRRLGSLPSMVKNAGGSGAWATLVSWTWISNCGITYLQQMPSDKVMQGLQLELSEYQLKQQGKNWYRQVISQWMRRITVRGKFRINQNNVVSTRCLEAVPSLTRQLLTLFVMRLNDRVGETRYIDPNLNEMSADFANTLNYVSAGVMKTQLRTTRIAVSAVRGDLLTGGFTDSGVGVWEWWAVMPDFTTWSHSSVSDCSERECHTGLYATGLPMTGKKAHTLTPGAQE